MSSFSDTSSLYLYKAPLIPHKQMVWWYKDLHSSVDDVSTLIGTYTSFIDHFIMDTAMRCGASLLRNRTIFVDDDEVIRRGGKKHKISENKSYRPRETLLVEMGMDFIYHDIIRPDASIPPFIQYRNSIPFVHAVYIILSESFLRTVSKYNRYVEETGYIRTCLEYNGADANLAIRLSEIEVKISSIERKINADKNVFYGVVRQIQFKMVHIKHMKGQVILAFRRLVMQLAKKYGRSEQQINDNFQHGSAGLIRAANYFDPYREKAFSGLARNWIQASILLHLKTEANMCKIPAPVWQLFRKLEQVCHNKDIHGDYAAIAAEVKMSVEDVMDIYHMIQINRPVSLENPVSENDPTSTLKDSIYDSSKSVEDILVDNSSSVASDYMTSLTDEERLIMCCLFGMYDHILQAENIPDYAIESEKLRQIASYYVGAV